MTNPLFDNMADTALRMLTDYGHDITLTRVTPGTYDPNTGTQGAATTTAYTAKGIVLNFSDYRVSNSGGLIKTGDRKLLVAARGLAIFPDPTTDTATLSGVTWKIENAIQPVNEVVIYELQVRRTGTGG